MVDSLYSKGIGNLFIDVKTSNSGVKYIQLTKLGKDKDGASTRSSVPLFADQIELFVDSIREAQEAMGL